MDWEVSIGGFVVGLLVGLTGMGGALVMTPMMIFWFGVNPTVAVGTDLLYSSITKLFGAWQHGRQKTVDWKAVRLLSYGSVPGAVLGVVFMMLLQNNMADSVQSVIGKLLGVTYVAIALFMSWQLYRMYLKQRTGEQTVTREEESTPQVQAVAKRMMGLGAVAGFVVGLTSVGSGTLFIAFLMLIYPIPIARLVGTDIVQAVLVTGVAGIAHLLMGNVDFTLVGQLLIGSIPGIVLGSRITVKVPEGLVKSALFLLVFMAGYKMLMK